MALEDAQAVQGTHEMVMHVTISQAAPVVDIHVTLDQVEVVVVVVDASEADHLNQEVVVDASKVSETIYYTFK